MTAFNNGKTPVALIAVPVLFVLGAASAAVRVYESGLPAPAGRMAYLSTALVFCCCVFLIAAMTVLLAGRVARRSSAGEGLRRVLLAASGVVFLMAALASAYEAAGASGLFLWVNAAFLAACGLTAILSVKPAASFEHAALFSLFPVYYLGFFLLVLYRLNADNPQTHTFSFEILCIVALMLAVYHISAIYFEKPAFKRMLFFCMLALYSAFFILLSFPFMPDALRAANGFTASNAVMLLAVCLRLIGYLMCPPERAAALKRADDPTRAQ